MFLTRHGLTVVGRIEAAGERTNRVKRLLRTALAAAVIATCGCAPHILDTSALGPELNTLPVGAAGAVVVGAQDSPSWGPRLDRDALVLFDAAGKPLGHIKSKYIEKPVSAPGLLAATTDAGVVVLRPSSRRVIPYERANVLATSRSNTGRSVAVALRNELIAVDAHNVRTVGITADSVQGLTACGDIFFALTDAYVGSSAPGRRWQLIELRPDGSSKVVSSSIEPDEFHAETWDVLCTRNGTELIGLFGHYRRDASSAEPVLRRINTGDGAHTDTRLSEVPAEPFLGSGSLAADGTLYWLAGRPISSVYAVSTSADPVPRKVWDLPRQQERAVDVQGSVVSVIDESDVPAYSEFDIATGERLIGPVRLPWLKSVLHQTDSDGDEQLHVLDFIQLRH